MFILMPAPAVIADSDATLRIPLRHLTADQVIQQLRFPNDAKQPGGGAEIAGLKGLVGGGSTLVVEGTADAREAVERLVKILDVPQARLQIRVRVVKVDDTTGKRRQIVLTEGTVMTAPGRSFQIHTEDDVTGWTFTGSATVRDDNKIRSTWTIEQQRLSYEFNGVDSFNATRNKVTSLCVGASGKPAVAAFFDTQGKVPDGVKGSTLDAITRSLPTNAYYVEVTAQQEKARR